MQFKLFGHLFNVNRLWCFITLAAFLILIKLSYWQWQRAAEKTEQLQQLAVLQQQGAISASQLFNLISAEADGVLVEDAGRWLAPYVWLLDNKIVEGRVGYDVLIPVQFQATAPALLVNLGWVAAPSSRQSLPEITIPAEISVSGLVRTKLGGVLLGQNLEGNTYPMRMQQVDITALQQQLPVPLYAAVIYQQAPSRFIPHYKAVVLPPEKHRGYAVQWLGLAIAVLGVALAASLQLEKKHE
ncbi:SURF1 family protein [Rheinheimera sp. UJ51]|uniref:SURF1 family protein n=1 Tax=Rheinheimera sp. UJ51 TaxID=2892446 RepID=UPI001E488B02|nr:SURF1 family protein [Rheinheimera sp. UJ51]MCC5452176.1 SURF1 family protein [Rheinheimera sp. UJ51]